ncbi:hypothetical protein ACFV1N_25565 [Streptosporangium canum]|uniref:hypothetical protein n=1 Tax=Streptosporangium canum TaxID=324952 RepID=UPI0036BDB1C4
MWYLANPSTAPVREAMRQGMLGMIATPAQGNLLPEGVVWGADNGCYTNAYPGDEPFLKWLTAHAAHASRCLFAAAPDVVGDAAATLARAAPLLPRIRAAGLPAALVAQDGLEDMAVPWASLDVLFLGGSTSWKLGPGARSLTRQALERGRAVHMGRVNSRRRMRYAAEIGCRSVDGTLITYGPDVHLPRLLSWVREVRNEMPLWQG